MTAQLKDLIEQSFGPATDQEFLHELTRSLESYLNGAVRHEFSSPRSHRTRAFRRMLSAVSSELSDLASSLPVAPWWGRGSIGS